MFNLLDEKHTYWSDVRGLSLVQSDNDPSTFVPPANVDAYTRPGRNASVSLSYRF